jgi:predicted nuclease of restriction endonuclease-like RecB superfamily
VKFDLADILLAKSRGVYVPRYLDVERDRSAVETLISFYRAAEGKTVGEIDWRELVISIGSRGLAKLLRLVMESRFYTAVNRVPSGINPKIVRIKLFRVVNKVHNGFASPENRGRVMQTLRRYLLAEGIQLDPDAAMWCTYRDMAFIKKVEEPSVKKIVEEYNIRTLNSLLINSTSLHITLHKNCASTETLMILGRGLKYYGGVYDIRRTGDCYRINIDGPRLLLNKPSDEYGLALSHVLLTVLPRLYSCKDNWRVDVLIGTKFSNMHIRLLSSDLKPLLPVERVNAPTPVFDTRADTHAYRRLKLLKLNVSIAVKPVEVKDLVYIPDLEVEEAGKKIYIEIVNYWNREYGVRKASKIREICQAIKNLIIVADERMKPFLQGLPTPIAYFTIDLFEPRGLLTEVADYVKNMVEEL